MQVTDVRLRLADPKDSAKAYGSFTLDNDFDIRDLVRTKKLADDSITEVTESNRYKAS